MVTAHHLLLDGWSVPILFRELLTAYGSDAALPVVRPYRDFLAWLAGQDRDKARLAWNDALDGFTEPALLAGAGRAAGSDAASGELPIALPDAVSTQLLAAARTAGLTLGTVATAVWGLVLAGVTGRSDVAVGTVVSGRPADLDGVEDMVGLFLNTRARTRAYAAARHRARRRPPRAGRAGLPARSPPPRAARHPA